MATTARATCAPDVVSGNEQAADGPYQPGQREPTRHGRLPTP
jgi:hypothetical protein